MYLAWEVLILGSLPPGVAMGSVSDVLAMIGCNPTISTAINIFSLFAIITSFLGVGMGCIDFLKGTYNLWISVNVLCDTF